MFFFSSRRRNTRWPRDWSSDVCSSDLPSVVADVKGDIAGMSQAADPPGEKLQKRFDTLGLTDWKPQANPVKIGRASCRERDENLAVRAAGKRKRSVADKR